MNKIGIFFGTDTGTTRLIAKKIAKALGPELADKPINVNRINIENLLKYDVLILGTPTYAEGIVPGASTGVSAGSWEEFLPQLQTVDLTGKLIATYGLGDQEKYAQHFADALMQLYSVLKKQNATLIGNWSTKDYQFDQSKSVVDGQFVGLVIDNNSQGMLTEERIKSWLEQIKPVMLEKLRHSAVEEVA